jgi:hypothetical protein
MNDLISIMLGILSILLVASVPLVLGGGLQALRKEKKISVSILGALSLALVLLLWWLFDWTMIVILGMRIPSLVGSFLVTWLLIEVGSSMIARRFPAYETGTQNKSGEGTA